jgi:hypothetical protein
MSDRFAGVPRGRALRGARRIAEYMLDDETQEGIVLALPREEFGLLKLGRDLVGFSGWIDFALAVRASGGKANDAHF